MRVTNTSKMDMDRIKELLKFAARSINDKGVEIHVKNSNTGWGGWAYRKIPAIANVAPDAIYLITMGLDMNDVPDHTWTKLKTIEKLWPGGIPLDDWEDAFVWLAAHELYHTKRYRTGKLMGSEYRPTKFAFNRLNEWRVATGRKAIQPVKQPNPFAGMERPGQNKNGTQAK